MTTDNEADAVFEEAARLESRRTAEKDGTHANLHLDCCCRRWIDNVLRVAITWCSALNDLVGLTLFVYSAAPASGGRLSHSIS